LITVLVTPKADNVTGKSSLDVKIYIRLLFSSAPEEFCCKHFLKNLWLYSAPQNTLHGHVIFLNIFLQELGLKLFNLLMKFTSLILHFSQLVDLV